MPTIGVKYDEKQIEAAIEHAMQAVPGEVERIRYTIGEDWAHEPAVFFRVLLKDPDNLYGDLPRVDEATKRRFMHVCNTVSRSISIDLRFEMYQPYFNFRTVAEQEEAQSPEWA